MTFLRVHVFAKKSCPMLTSSTFATFPVNRTISFIQAILSTISVNCEKGLRLETCGRRSARSLFHLEELLNTKQVVSLPTIPTQCEVYVIVNNGYTIPIHLRMLRVLLRHKRINHLIITGSLSGPCTRKRIPFICGRHNLIQLWTRRDQYRIFFAHQDIIFWNSIIPVPKAELSSLTRTPSFREQHPSTNIKYEHNIFSISVHVSTSKDPYVSSRKCSWSFRLHRCPLIAYLVGQKLLRR